MICQTLLRLAVLSIGAFHVTGYTTEWLLANRTKMNFAAVEADRATTVQRSSELAHMIKVGVKQLLHEIYSSGSHRNVLKWHDAKGERF
jgi:hypothetical protein